MIRINFDPSNPAHVPGSLPLGTGDLKDGAELAVKLRDAAAPLSAHLKGAFSQELRQSLDAYDGSAPLPESLRDALLAELNRLLSGPPLYDRSRFRGTVWDREFLIKETVKREPAGDDLLCLNRLLLEEFYPDEIARSPKAEWDAWNFLARAETENIVGQWEAWKAERDEWKKKDEASRGPAPEFKAKLNDDIWRGFRDWLLVNVFRNKCAYCETEVVGNPGDAEHFRPKGRVRVVSEDDDESTIIKVVDESGEEMEHPGYFWLAYHWQNLLPSCEFCNRFGGKQDLFPVKNLHVAVKRLTVEEVDELLEKILQSTNDTGVYYLQPRDLDKLEGRLLLHPYYDNPEDHLRFDTDGRAAEWMGSEQGRVSKTVYNLNHPQKVGRRRLEQRRGLKLYYTKLGGGRDDADEISEYRRVAQELKGEYYGGSRPYAVAVFDFIHDRLEDTDVDPDLLLGERRKKG